MAKDWLEWHKPYDEPGSSLSLRLQSVQRHLREIIARRPPGPIRVVSVCAGQGRDLLGALSDHPRRHDVVARLVELDERNAAVARATAAELQLPGIEVVTGDGSVTTTYEGAVPADVLMLCGVFGNVVDDDIRVTVEEAPALCAPGAQVIWTRYPRDPDLLPRIDGWFRAAGFECEVLETGEGGARFGIGVHRLTGPTRPFRPGVTLFRFLDDPDPMGTRRP